MEIYRKHIRIPHVMLSTIVSNFFSFEGYLAKKWPYKHRGKSTRLLFYNWLVIIMHFITGLYGNFTHATIHYVGFLEIGSHFDCYFIQVI